MTSIEFNATVDLTATFGDKEVDLTVKDLDQKQLDDLLFVVNSGRIEDFKDLRFRRTVLEVLSKTPRHDMDEYPIGSESIEVDALASLVCKEFQPFETTTVQELDRKQTWEFKDELHMILFDLRSMGVVNMHYDNDYHEKEVCLTKVGSALCDLLFKN